MKNILAYLTPRGSTLPSGESSRLYQISGSERYVVEYPAGSDTYAYWSIPIVPDQYTSNPSIALAWRGLDSTTYCTWAVSCEVIVPDVSTQDLSTSSFDSDNSTQAYINNQYLQETSIDLTFNDTLVASSFLRIKIKRTGTATSPNTDVGDVELLGATLYCKANEIAWNEIPTGTIDGSNGTFTLVNSPESGNLLLTKNGLTQLIGTDYTLSGSTITFPGGNIPQVNDNLIATYEF